MTELSASQIQRLGDRLRKKVTAEDLALLRDLRDSYRPALDVVFDGVVKVLSSVDLLEACDIATRPAKTTRSIIAKLQRERTNLSRMQDIAGCRVVVPTAADQELAVASIVEAFPDWRVEDRRQRPSHGYRAVHFVTSRPRPVEVQVRTRVQQFWAMVSEALDRRFEGIKYGHGPEPVVSLLQDWSDRLAAWEAAGDAAAALLADQDRFYDQIGAMLELEP